MDLLFLLWKQTDSLLRQELVPRSFQAQPIFVVRNRAANK